MQGKVLAVSICIVAAAVALARGAGPTDQLVQTVIAKTGALEVKKLDASRFQRYSSAHSRLSAMPVFYRHTTARLPASGEVIVYKNDTSARAVVLKVRAGQTVMGNYSSYSLTVYGESVHMQLVGTNWYKF